MAKSKNLLNLNDFKIEMVPIDQLCPNPKNAKAHPEVQIEKITQSLQEYGAYKNIVINADNLILAGNGSYLAYKKLGVGVIPCYRLTHLSAAQEKGLALMDNKSSESEWLPEMLAQEFTDLQAMDFDLELTGFDMADIEAMMGGDLGTREEDQPKYQFRPGEGNLKLTKETERGPEQLLVPNPKLQEKYDDVKTIVVQYSGGKDSSGALIWAKTNFPDKKIICLYVDTSVEFPDLAWHNNDVADFFQVDLEIVKPATEFWTYCRRKGMWPSIIFRDCIEKFIKNPCIPFLKKMDENTTLFCGGMRVEESVRGSKKTETTSTYGNIRAYHPAYFLSKPSIEEAIKVSGMPVWRGYGQGFVRTACWCCPGMRGAQALALSRIYPGLADIILWYEKNHLGVMRPNGQPPTGFQHLVDIGKRKEERALKKAAGEEVHEPAEDEDPDVFAAPPLPE